MDSTAEINQVLVDTISHMPANRFPSRYIISGIEIHITRRNEQTFQFSLAGDQPTKGITISRDKTRTGRLGRVLAVHRFDEHDDRVLVNSTFRLDAAVWIALDLVRQQSPAYVRRLMNAPDPIAI
jgi:hypothetical protein